MNDGNLNIHLPVCLKADIISECWNFYRMAVINAYSELDPYLFNQFNHIYMDKNNEIHYGLSLYKTNIHQAYSSVLSTTSKPLHLISSKQAFVEQIIEDLKQKRYPVVECDFSIIKEYLEKKRSPFYLHEILIYGIENNNFIIPHMRNGAWVEVTLPTDIVAAAFWSRKNISLEIEKSYLWRREYMAPYTILQPHRQLKATPPHLYDFYKDICTILERSCIETQLLLTKEYYGKEYPGVLAVYNGVLELLHDILGDKFDPFKGGYSFELNIKRLHEYICLFYKHVLFFQNLSCCTFSIEIHKEWETIQLHTKQAYLLAIKYQIIRDKKVLYAISDAICFSFQSHHNVLEKMKDCIEERLLSHLQ